MKRHPLQFFILILVLLSGTILFGSALELDQINRAIRAKGAAWTAGETWVSRLSPEEQNQLLGAFIESEEPDSSRLILLPQATNLPSLFDWRDNNGNWVTPVRHQKGCGSCWAFGSVAHVEAWYKIQSGDPNTEIDLSEQYLVSPCCNAGSCSWGSSFRAYQYIMTHGIPTESCFPYQASDSVPCDDACAEVNDQLQTIPGWGYITLQAASVVAIKTALMYQPVGAHFNTYEDFIYFQSGVYEHVWGEMLDVHVIIIVGWDDSEQCWICKNSWGATWGNNGFFKIKWGVADIGVNTRFIWADTTATPAVQLEPTSLNFSLDHGDSISANITIQNNGNEPLEYAAIDNEIPVLFHPSQFNSYDASSWWCGDPEIGGYGQRWLQYLDTPILNLAQTQAPELNFMACWAVQSCDSIKAEWNGNDGCNVWVSIDGGENFNVITPETPQYNCQSLLSFGKNAQGWDMGPNIPGWGDTSNGWVPIKFNLQNFCCDQVIIRFAFASDYSEHTRENAELTGFFIDEITVTDGSSTLFTDHGDNGQIMQPLGFGSTIADWLELPSPHGELMPQESRTITVDVGGKNVPPRLYSGHIQIRNNAKNQNIPITLEVKPVDFEIGLSEIQFEESSRYDQLTPLFRIYNYGRTPAENIQVHFSVRDFTGNVIRDETSDLPSLHAGYSHAIAISPLKKLTLNMPYTVNVELLMPSNDKITTNNQQNHTHLPLLQETVSDSVTTHTNWDFSGSWNVFEVTKTSPVYQLWHRGNMAVTSIPETGIVTNAGNLTLRYPINLQQYRSAHIDFTLLIETINETVNTPDFNLQISTDSLSWENVDYTIKDWPLYETSLDPYIVTNVSEVWLRFHFQTNGTVEGKRYYLDNIRLVTTEKTGIDTQTQTVKNFQLSQNYPNPFNSSTRIFLTLPEPGRVNLNIYNIRGELVRRLLHNEQHSGAVSAIWDGHDDHGQLMPSGVYFVRLEVGNQADVLTKKMILLK